MNISYNWLKDYINLSDAPEQIAADLTSIGLEVGSIESFSSIQGGLKGFVTGEVLTCAKHPNADKLSITTVNVGGPEILNIVCGAPNVTAGQKVVVATVGTTIYTADGSFEIKKAKIRGEDSAGMICAEDEMGLGSSHAGIMVLPQDTPIGMPAAEYFKIENDFVLEVDLTPNRIDAASHIGVARDLAAYKNLNYSKPDLSSFAVKKNSYKIEVEVENVDACPRYSGICLDNIKVGDSPDWLKNRLKAIGLNPINNIVDVTNFVLHETGQPLHAFDGDKIAGNKIIVKPVNEGQKFVTLDNAERTLKSSDLMICNSNSPMCIAGVFGGIESGITENTTKIFLESAYFNPVWVRKTAKTHSISTDSSFRFERGADVNMTVFAAKRAAMLIEMIGAGEISSDIIDIYPTNIENRIVDFSYASCCRLIGMEIPASEIDRILEKLEIKIIERNGDHLKLEIPSYRVDVYREADVVEDVLRIYGYNNIIIPSKINLTVANTEKPDREKLVNTVSDLLVANGFYEIMCNSQISTKYFDENDNTIVRIYNPLSNDLGIMRPSPVFGGLESVAYNTNRKISDIKFFEFGRTYHAKENNSNLSDIRRYSESKFLAMWISGKKNPLNWNLKDNPSDFFNLKSYIDLIFAKLGLNIEKYHNDLISDSVFEYGISHDINNKVLCRYGKISNALVNKTDISQDVYYAEINWDLVLDLVKNQKTVYVPVSKFPKVKRDLALLIDKEVSYKQLKEIALKTEKEYITDISLFDVYEGKNLEPGKVSYALSFTLEDTEKTMTDQQIDKIMRKLITAFEMHAGAKIR
ncbi:MAG: phenylalanine--tRNA ligase subunit beta [Bacteroidales bacterium]|nr:phenylalanine--tRNA ligase subunit beta [Bacteroidales bacterium]